MTYNELLEELKTLTPEQLKQGVQVHLPKITYDEFVPVRCVAVTVWSTAEGTNGEWVCLAS